MRTILLLLILLSIFTASLFIPTHLKVSKGKGMFGYTVPVWGCYLGIFISEAPQFQLSCGIICTIHSALFLAAFCWLALNYAKKRHG